MPNQEGLLGTFEQLVLLAALKAGGDAYPPRLGELIADASGRTPSRGAIYVTLDRLEAKGLIESSPVNPTAGRGGRPRHSVAGNTGPRVS